MRDITGETGLDQVENCCDKDREGQELYTFHGEVKGLKKVRVMGQILVAEASIFVFSFFYHRSYS